MSPQLKKEKSHLPMFNICFQKKCEIPANVTGFVASLLPSQPNPPKENHQGMTYPPSAPPSEKPPGGVLLTSPSCHWHTSKMARPTTHRVARFYPRQWAVDTAPVGQLKGKRGEIFLPNKNGHKKIFTKFKASFGLGVSGSGLHFIIFRVLF